MTSFLSRFAPPTCTASRPATLWLCLALAVSSAQACGGETAQCLAACSSGIDLKLHFPAPSGAENQVPPAERVV